ncbi:MAG: type III secretion system export apparatus subunit SctR [Gammaproteobacteria bacterium]
MDALPSPFLLLGGLSILAVAPFLAIMVSSYLKIVVVMFILRNAIGLQQAPPTLAINGLAIILSLFIMAPVGVASIDAFKSHNIELDDLQNPELYSAIGSSLEPVKNFLDRHSDKDEREFFVSTTKRLWPDDTAVNMDEQHILVLMPSFVLSELKSAFQIGFLVYLPFIVIDLVVSNILLSMGMIMMSPIMISLPFKILLFVMADGWTRLIHGLVLSYV